MGNAKQRNLILNAVVRVIVRDGFAFTTIDAVAAEAGISKGGALASSAMYLMDGLYMDLMLCRKNGANALWNGLWELSRTR